MSYNRQERKARQNLNSDPINFTCGQCKRVSEYIGSLECPHCGYGKDVVEEEVSE